MDINKNTIITFNCKDLFSLDINKIKKYLDNNQIINIKKVINKKKINQIKKYLSGISKSTIPNFHSIKIGAPNNYRVNLNDTRSIVKGWFYQFSFYPWNQDIFNFYDLFKKVFILKNRINKLNDLDFFNPKNNKDCTIRLSYQFYPTSTGFLNQHQDPVDYHQKYLMLMTMSKKGKDFKKGGLFVNINKKKINVDNYSDLGDLIIFKANLPHGVEKIDPYIKNNPLGSKGRWMALFATNKLTKNTIVSDSIDKKKS